MRCDRLVKCLALVSFSVALTTPSDGLYASDGDSLTQRKKLLSPCHPDATGVLDGMINKRFQLALGKVNRKRNPSRLDLEQALLSEVGDKKILGIKIPVGSLEKPIDDGLTKEYRVHGKRVRIASLKIERSKSIYRDAKLLGAPGVVLGMASHFKIGQLVIGSDKLTHFFAQGHEYIEVQRKSGLRAAVNHGTDTENGKYGLKGNGIFSFGDLAANYSGLKFWTNLTHSTAGHFRKCNGKWIQTRRFSWHCHINPAWDEGINPPCGPTVNKTKRYVAALVRCNRIDHCPPLHQEKIPSIADSYPEWVLKKVLNPQTLALANSSTSSDTRAQ